MAPFRSPLRVRHPELTLPVLVDNRDLQDGECVHAGKSEYLATRSGANAWPREHEVNERASLRSQLHSSAIPRPRARRFSDRRSRRSLARIPTLVFRT